MNSSSTLVLMLRMGVSLAIILGLIWAASRFVRRRGSILGKSSTDVEVVAKRSTGRRSSLLVVKVAGRTLLVGATDTQVSLVADVTDLPAEQLEPAGLPSLVQPSLAPASLLPEPVLVLPTSGPAPGPVALDGGRSVDLRQTKRPVVASRGTGNQLLDSIRDLTVRRT